MFVSLNRKFDFNWKILDEKFKFENPTMKTTQKRIMHERAHQHLSQFLKKYVNFESIFSFLCTRFTAFSLFFQLANLCRWGKWRGRLLKITFKIPPRGTYH